LEWNEGVAVIPGVPGHVLEFQTRVEVHSQTSFAVVLGLAHSDGDVAEEAEKRPVDAKVRKLRPNDQLQSGKTKF
jgi:hypothetical protein